jgi:hypothetical protein
MLDVNLHQLFLMQLKQDLIDKNLAKVLTKTQEIQQQLKNLVTQDIIGGTMGADTLLPDRKTQK